MSPGQIRRLARRGLLAPERTDRNHYRFSFRDITFLRTTTELLNSQLPRHRVHRALRELRRQQPRDRPLSELQLTATSDGIVAHDGNAVWDAESGQVMLGLAATQAPAAVTTFRPAQAVGVRDARDIGAWLRRAADLEERDPDEARSLYRRILALQPGHYAARINLGRLVQSQGAYEEAIEHYRIVLSADPGYAIAAFNLGVALEESGRPHEAFAAYAQALAADPTCAEAHYNIAQLYEEAGDQLAALRHLHTYRDLTTP